MDDKLQTSPRGVKIISRVFVPLRKRTPMKTTAVTLILGIFLFILIGGGCTGSSSPQEHRYREGRASEEIGPSIIGTWQLLTVLTIEGEDSVLTEYTKGVRGIKILNDTHFAFFQHDLNQGKESDSLFVSGGGTYTYLDGIYTENLEYCNFRFYENHTFNFEVVVNGDSRIQRGEEEVAEAGISKYIIETYVRVDK